MTLCALADVKTLLDISGDTQDAKLTLFIKRVSAQIQKHLGYAVAWKDYVDEQHAINNRQLLQLNAQPIQGAISSITLDGVPVTDFSQEPDYDAVGLVYRGDGWVGNWYVAGMTYDPMAGFHSILVSYTGGWHLPGDDDYEEDDDPASLPYGISAAAEQATIELYNIREAGGEGFKAQTEGGLNTTFRDDSGLSPSVMDMLAPYKRWAVA
jgi:hypothetical protein